jgi:phospholipase C
MTRKRVFSSLLIAILAAGALVVVAQAASAGPRELRGRVSTPNIASHDAPTTPIRHLVVIFQENVSFDHYFGTYPHAMNPSGEPAFYPSPRTPTVNGLTAALLTHNPNAANPQRLDRSEALTCDQNHEYTAEQQAYDHGAMDKFVESTNNSTCSPPDKSRSNLVMDYYDGNTVTGLWNYAQHFAMSDNSYSTTFGPSTPGAMNVVAGNTFGAICGPADAVYQSAPCLAAPGAAPATPGSPQPQGPGTTYSDADPNFDKCSGGGAAGTMQMGGKNIGDLLDQAGITWGWFQGGFADCHATHKNIGGATVTDYSPHHEPFQYYASTANPQHLPPSSVAMIGHQDQADHQYDLKDFWAAADSGNLPAVSYLKAAKYQDGHPGYSDPLDEQDFLISTINHLERLPSWKSTAVVIAYDDSDGWYDHQVGPVTTQSQTPLDALTDPGQCGSNPKNVPAGQQARCGVGMRQPLLVISPYSKRNFVDGTFTDQSSVVRFIEDNWLAGARIGNGSVDAQAGVLNNMFQFSRGSDQRLLLDPTTGEPTGGEGHRHGAEWGRRRR